MPSRSIAFFLGIFLAVGITPLLEAQKKILHDSLLMKKVKIAVDQIYGYSFPEAEKSLQVIQAASNSHPVNPLLRALLIYQQDYPLQNNSPRIKEFIASCEESIRLCQNFLAENDHDVEGVAFDMLSRALLNMYYVDAGESMRVAANATGLYRSIAKGFNMMDAFDEFYFTTGLYNYYREAYPTAHPVYKPVAALFPIGNQEKGLQQLKYAAGNCIFLKSEAHLFLSLIYNNYENNPALAALYAGRLHKMYPENLYFLNQYIEALYINRQFGDALPFINRLLAKGKNNKFMVMNALFYKGIYEDRILGNPEQGKKNIETAIIMASHYGRYGEPVITLGHFSLSRIYRMAGDKRNAEKYFRMGKSEAIYAYQSKFAD